MGAKDPSCVSEFFNQYALSILCQYSVNIVHSLCSPVTFVVHVLSRVWCRLGSEAFCLGWDKGSKNPILMPRFAKSVCDSVGQRLKEDQVRWINRRS